MQVCEASLSTASVERQQGAAGCSDSCVHKNRAQGVALCWRKRRLVVRKCCLCVILSQTFLSGALILPTAVTMSCCRLPARLVELHGLSKVFQLIKFFPPTKEGVVAQTRDCLTQSAAMLSAFPRGKGGPSEAYPASRTTHWTTSDGASDQQSVLSSQR